MSFRARAVMLLAGVLLLALAGVRHSHADEKSVLKKIATLNTTAMAAYKAGNYQAAKDKLMEAVVLGKENGLGTHAAVARTYLNLGVVHIEGFMDEDRGVRYFGSAQRIRSDIKLDQALTTDAVTAAFDRAHAEVAATPANHAEEETEAAAAETEPAKPAGKDAAREAAAAKEAAAKEAAARREASANAANNEKLQKLLTQTESEKKRVSETHQAAQGRWERDKLDLEKQLLEAKAGEKKEREARERVEKEKAELEKQLAQTRDKFDKEKAEREKLVAEGKEREKQDREAKDKLQKEKAERDKQLAETMEREKKERDIREKLDKEKQAAATRDKERKEKEERERLERERLADGPELPGSLPAPLYCPIPEGEAGSDLYIHCATQGQVKAKEIAIYYRSSGMLHYNSLTMHRSRRGWQVAAVPADKIKGSTVQYYAQALGGKGEVVASNGKPKSPNIALIRPRGLRVAGGDSEGGALTRAGAKSRRVKK